MIDPEKKFYGAASSAPTDITQYLRENVEKLKSLHVWRTGGRNPQTKEFDHSEVIVALLDYEWNPPVGTKVLIFRRYVEEETNLYYWQLSETTLHYESGYSPDLMWREEKFEGNRFIGRQKWTKPQETKNETA